jgi:hypothetical protein
MLFRLERRINESIALELLVRDALVAGDPAADVRLLHDDFLAVYSNGFAAKDAHVGHLDGGACVVNDTLDQIETRP